jgi:hypothetical protein
MEAKRILEHIDNTDGNNVIEKISSLLPTNPIVTVDVGQHECWCAQSLTIKGYDGRILIGGGYGSWVVVCRTPSEPQLPWGRLFVSLAMAVYR